MQAARVAVGLLVVFMCLRAESFHPPDPTLGTVTMDAFSQGATLDLLVTEKTAATSRLVHFRSSDGGVTWGPAQPLAGDFPLPLAPHRGDDPQIAAFQKKVLVVWTAVSTAVGKMHGPRGLLASAVSEDGGKTWSKMKGPDPGNVGEGPSYIDLAVDPHGRVHAVWLDTRDGHRGLRYSQSSDFGRTWQAVKTLDAKTCECCWNRIYAFTSTHLHALYRNIEPRDMAVAISKNGGSSWATTASLEGFKWDFKGCPHVGGGLALVRGVAGDELHSLIWNGKDQKRGMYYGISRDMGLKWEIKSKIADPEAQRGDLCASRAKILRVWDSAGHDGRHVIQAQISVDQGKSWSEVRRLTAPESGGSFPMAFASGGGFVVFWLEKPKATGSRVWKSALIND